MTSTRQLLLLEKTIDIAGPCSMSFHYNTNEMLEEFNSFILITYDKISFIMSFCCSSKNIWRMDIK